MNKNSSLPNYLNQKNGYMEGLRILLFRKWPFLYIGKGHFAFEEDIILYLLAIHGINSILSILAENLFFK